MRKKKGVKRMEMDRRVLKLLNKLGFSDHPEKPMLYQKQVDDNTTAYIDFRKKHNASGNGRRFARRGEDFIDDPDEIDVLRLFKEERDRLEQEEATETKKTDFESAGILNSELLDFIKNIVGSDVLEIFGDTGAGDKERCFNKIDYDHRGERKGLNRSVSLITLI
jgi:hypothetical protein